MIPMKTIVFVIFVCSFVCIQQIGAAPTLGGGKTENSAPPTDPQTNNNAEDETGNEIKDKPDPPAAAVNTASDAGETTPSITPRAQSTFDFLKLTNPRIQQLLATNPSDQNDFSYIDLTTMKKCTLKYFKHALILYTQIIETKLLKKNYQFGKVESDLKNFNDAEEENPNPCAKLLTSQPLPKYQELISIGNEIVTLYDNEINNSHKYMNQAFYYKALIWIRWETQGYSPLASTVARILKETKDNCPKAKNYLVEMIETKHIRKFVDVSENKYKTIDGWTIYDAYNYAFAIIRSIANSRDENLANIPTLLCKDIAIYEQILDRVDADKFFDVFYVTPHNVLGFIDNLFHLRSNDTENPTTSPYTTAIELDNINLANIRKKTLQYIKHVFLLFNAAIKLRYQINLLNEQDLKVLKPFPVRVQATFETIRYSTFQRKFAEFLILMGDRMKANMHKVGDTATDKMHFFRLFEWFKTHVDYSWVEDQSVFADFSMALSHFEDKTKPKHILKDLTVTFPDQFANTLDDLIHLGLEEDNAVSTMLYIGLGKLATNLQEEKGTEQEIESKKDVNKPTKLKMFPLIEYGNCTAGVLSTIVSTYDNVLKSVKRDTFEDLFYMTTEEMLQYVRYVVAEKMKETDIKYKPLGDDDVLKGFHMDYNDGVIPVERIVTPY